MKGALISSIGRFLEFMMNRESMRLKKESGASWPWTDDPILQEFRFTNVKREHDRTTRWMRKHWTGQNLYASSGEIIFNCALFRYFGTIQFASAVGWQSRWDPASIVSSAELQIRRGEKIFTGAYIIPTLGVKEPKHRVVVERILTPLWFSREELGHLARNTKSWRAVGQRLMQQKGFGGTGFMAKETLQDAMQTPALGDAIDRNTWCPIGPGARRGLNRVFGRPTKFHQPFDRSLADLMILFEVATAQLPYWMPALELHDIQFQLCEFDKYERFRLGEGRPKAKYDRFKKREPV